MLSPAVVVGINSVHVVLACSTLTGLANQSERSSSVALRLRLRLALVNFQTVFYIALSVELLFESTLSASQAFALDKAAGTPPL